jgi:hypothetical protein
MNKTKTKNHVLLIGGYFDFAARVIIPDFVRIVHVYHYVLVKRIGADFERNVFLLLKLIHILSRFNSALRY